MRDEYMIEENGTEVAAPTRWGPALRKSSGVINGDAPATPFAIPGTDRTLREVRHDRPVLLKWQQASETGRALDGEVWAISYEAVDPDAIALGGIRASLQAIVDDRAEQERAKHVTTKWGQEVIYVDKEAEAKALDADATLAESETPYLTAEATALGVARETLKAEILTNSAGWRALSVAIEANRVAIKAAIRAADLGALRLIDIEAGWPG